MRHKTSLLIMLMLAVATCVATLARAAESQAAANAVNPDKPFVAEYYYKASSAVTRMNLSPCSRRITIPY